jgi:cell division protein FtsQ
VRRGRIVLALAVLGGLAAAYLGWVRDLPVFAVERVEVSGLRSAEADEVRSALERAARGMTSLHVREGRLRQAVAGFASVRSLQASGRPPDTLRVRVREHRPVAALAAPGAEPVPVAADGTVLRGLAGGDLPRVGVPGAIAGERLEEGRARRLVRVVASAPDPVARRIERVGVRPGVGVVAALRAGPEVRLGAAAGLEEKWTAATAVLADPNTAGASYVDVRLPERPVAGGLPDGAGGPEDEPDNAQAAVETSRKAEPPVEG